MPKGAGLSAQPQVVVTRRAVNCYKVLLFRVRRCRRSIRLLVPRRRRTPLVLLLSGEDLSW